MPDKEPTVDSAGEPTVESENQPSIEDLVAQITKVKEENDHWRAEADKFRDQAKDAFAKRDKVKNDLRAEKENTATKSDLQQYAEKLKTDLDEKTKLLSNMEENTIRTTKINALQTVAREQGIKDIYVDKLVNFVDLENVNPEKKVSLRLEIDSVKSSYPDFFSANGTAVDNALPNPKLNSSGVGTYKEQYAKLLGLPRAERTQEVVDRMIELKELISS